MLYHTHVQRVPYQPALAAYRALRSQAPSILLESGRGHDVHSRFSIIGHQPALGITGCGTTLALTLLQDFAQPLFDHVRAQYATYIVEATSSSLLLDIPPTPFVAEEAERPTRLCPAQVLRSLLLHFGITDKNYMGFYGALGYRFIYPYEDITRRLPDDTPDFKLYLFHHIVFINHLTEDCTLYCTAATAAQASAAAATIAQQLAHNSREGGVPFLAQDIATTPDGATYEQQVADAVALCRQGELLELVLSRKLSVTCTGDSLQLYAAYTHINPAPYQFYFEAEDEVLLGASPEMMLRAEQGRVVMRPISGSSRRGSTAIEEHALMLALLNADKEKRELDMLIDLARNDLARVCQPGVVVEEYRAIDKYATVMHTTAQVAGQLPPDTLAYDALVACMNAGTLTGAPKLAAMQYIEAIEQHTRGYYGGAIGYLLLNNEINTGITIRAAHIRQGRLHYLAGATLLVGSDPAAELQETKIKTDAFAQALSQFMPQHHHAYSAH